MSTDGTDEISHLRRPQKIPSSILGIDKDRQAINKRILYLGQLQASYQIVGASSLYTLISSEALQERTLKPQLRPQWLETKMLYTPLLGIQKVHNFNQKRNTLTLLTYFQKISGY